MRRLLVPALLFLAVFAVTSVAALATETSVSVAVVVTVVFGFLWLLGKDVRRKPWPSESQRAQDAAYMAAGIAAMHMPAQGAADCPSGYDSGFSGGCDAGGGL